MKKSARIIVSVAVALGCLALASPFIAAELGLFSHAVHLEEGAECGECHVADDGAGPPLVNKKYCEECHDDGVPSYRLPARARKLGGGFPHATHVEAGDCKECHQATIADAQKAGAWIMAEAKCEACHKENDVEVKASNCAACHAKGRRLQVPADHGGSWMLKHGDESRWQVFGGHTKDCSSCHRRDACATCHRTKRPQSHTGLWRLRGHGLSAGWDRDSCRTCHETGACISCHKTTRPFNHVGAWRSRHGSAMGAESNCSVCHISHVSTCGTCHGSL